MKKIIMFVVILFTIGIVNSGICQIRPGTFSITPYIGGTTFEGNLDLDTNPVYGVKLGTDITKQIGAEIVLGIIRTHYTERPYEIKTFVYNYRIEGLYYFMPEKRLVPYAAAGIGTQVTDYRKDIQNKARFVADYGIGLKYFWNDSMALRADIRHILASGSIYNNLEYTVGISFLFGGVKQAPVAISKPVAIAKPEPVPEAPKLLSEPGRLYASAASEEQIHVSWDAVEGAVKYKVYRDGAYAFTTDKCMAFDKGLNPDTRYCYQVCAVDENDLDSPLSSEKCAKTLKPKVIELKKPAAAAPVMTEKEKKAAEVAKVIREKGKATIDIKFDLNKANVKPQYHDELEKFALVLKNNPDINIVIAGHTDSTGSEAYNLKLSQRRAESVRAYLIKKFGIAEDRLKAKGYGEARPDYDNRVAIGRAKNRRVEAVAEYIKK